MAATDPPTASAEQALAMYRLMVAAREFDEQLGTIFAEGRLAGWLHSSIGHEATGATLVHCLRPDDHLVPYHRSRVSLLAKGMTVAEVAAEMMGRATAESRGRGGDGHLVHPARRVYGMSGVLGAGVPIAAGVAYAARLRGRDEVVVCGFGEGTANRGAVHEGINLAAIWDLPVVYVCENNLYAEFSPIADQMATEHVADRAAGYGVPSEIVDGNDPDAILPVVAAAVERARAGGGPTLIEAKTYRLRGHYEGDPQEYRDSEEVERWRARDPLPTYRARLLGDGRADAATLEALEADAAAEVEAAMAAALAAPLPTAADLVADVYAGEGAA